MDNELEELDRRLVKWFNNAVSPNPLSMDDFMELSLMRDISWDRAPVGLEDFPIDCQHAIVAYGKFPDIVVSQIGFMGKDFSSLGAYFQMYENEINNKRLFFETLLRIDSLFVEHARKSRA